MKPAPTLAAACVAVVLGTVSCATPKTEPAPATARDVVVVAPEAIAEAVIEVPATMELTPTAPRGPRVAGIGAGPADGEPIKVMPKDEGWKIPELLQTVSSATGVSFVYDGHMQQIKHGKMYFVGEQHITSDRALDWLRAMLYHQKLVLVPAGPDGSAIGKTLPENVGRWVVLDMANPSVQSSRLYVPADKLEAYADSDGLYAMTTFRLAPGVNTSKIRSAMSQFLTRTAGIGSLTDVPDPPSLMVSDFTPNLAMVKRALEEMGVHQP